MNEVHAEYHPLEELRNRLVSRGQSSPTGSVNILTVGGAGYEKSTAYEACREGDGMATRISGNVLAQEMTCAA
jgi:hypothetical protein